MNKCVMHAIGNLPILWVCGCVQQVYALYG
jgi:hypothetical protein